MSAVRPLTMIPDGQGRYVLAHTSTDGSPLPVLYDPTGVALNPTERAPDTQTVPLKIDSWRVDRWREHYARGVTPERLAAVHDQAESGDPGPQEAMHEEMLEKDTRGASLFGMRAAAAKAVKWELVPARSTDPKAKVIRDSLKIHPLDPEWTPPGRMDENPMAWMIQVNGLIVDARRLPREIQEEAFRGGLISYLPADRAGDPAEE